MINKIQHSVVFASWSLVAGVALVLVAGQVGLIRVSQSYDLMLALGEHPGVMVLSVMLLCRPLQKLTRRSWVTVRKHTGIVFGILAAMNGILFFVTRSRFSSTDPFIAVALAAVIVCIPLLATSTNWARKTIGVANWKKLHSISNVLPILVGLHLVMNPNLPVGITFTTLLFASIVRLPLITNLFEPQKALKVARS